MSADPWLQLGLGGGALFIVLVVVLSILRRRGPDPVELVVSAIRELATDVRDLTSGIKELAGQSGINSQRLSRLEAKLDIAFDWTPVSSPIAALPSKQAAALKPARGTTPAPSSSSTEHGPAVPPHPRHRTNG